MCFPAEFGRSRSQRYTSVIKEIGLKTFDPRVPFSRSLKVIGTDTDRSATYDFLLTFHSNHGPILYCFQGKMAISVEIAIFPTAVYFSPR